MNAVLKNSIWVGCLVLAIAVLGLFTFKVATTDPDAMIPGYEVEAVIQEHKPHTHEHAGLACCPCGICHKHNEDDGENTIIDPPIWIRLTALATFVTVMMSAITGMFWC
jgi:hypothetical protein